MKNLILMPVMILVCLSLVLVPNSGCTKKSEKLVPVQVDGEVVPKQAPQGPPDYKNRKIMPDRHLPSAATNVQLFNNYWTYFELDVGGKTRKFLMHHSHPKDDWQGRESLVELKD